MNTPHAEPTPAAVLPSTYPTPHIARLRAVFEMVQNPEHWKLPVNAVVLESEATAEELREAVIFFAGCVPTVTPTTVPMRHRNGFVEFEFAAFHVTAVGYFAAVGA